MQYLAYRAKLAFVNIGIRADSTEPANFAGCPGNLRGCPAKVHGCPAKLPRMPARVRRGPVHLARRPARLRRMPVELARAPGGLALAGLPRYVRARTHGGRWRFQPCQTPSHSDNATRAPASSSVAAAVLINRARHRPGWHAEWRPTRLESATRRTLPRPQSRSRQAGVAWACGVLRVERCAIAKQHLATNDGSRRKISRLVSIKKSFGLPIRNMQN